MSTSRATYLWKLFLSYPSKCRTNPFFETKSDGLWLVDDHSYTACTSSFIASAFIPHETTLRLFTPNLGCFGYFHPFLPYRQPFLPLSTRFTTVNIYCQLSSVTITYPKINYTSLTHFSTIFSYFNTFDPFFDCFSTCFRTSPRVANPLHSYLTYNVHLRSPQPIFDLIYTKTALSSDFWPRGTRFLPHGTRLAPVPNYRHTYCRPVSVITKSFEPHNTLSAHFCSLFTNIYF